MKATLDIPKAKRIRNRDNEHQRRRRLSGGSCVIRYNIRFAGEESSEYALIRALEISDAVTKEVLYYKPKMYPIPAKVARQMIADRGLVRVKENDYGVIWDTPEQDFKKMYSGRMDAFSLE